MGALSLASEPEACSTRKRVSHAEIISHPLSISAKSDTVVLGFALCPRLFSSSAQAPIFRQFRQSIFAIWLEFRQQISPTSFHNIAKPSSSASSQRGAIWANRNMANLQTHLAYAHCDVAKKAPPALAFLPLADCPITRSSSYLIGKLCKVNILIPKLWGGSGAGEVM